MSEQSAEKDAPRVLDPKPLPDLERGALVMADLAWMETEGSPAGRTEAAIRAYLWAVEVAAREGWYPSLNQWREASVIPPAKP